MSKKNSPNIIIWESIGISVWELNKVHDIYVQFVSDKKIKEWLIIDCNISQRVALYTFIHLVHFSYIVGVIQLYSGTINE